MKNYSYVYFLVKSDKSSFKIGKANDTLLRYHTFKSFMGEVDEGLSFQIKCNDSFVFVLESILHKSMSDYNIELDAGDGYTEYFDINCYEYAKSLVTKLMNFNKNIIKIESIDFNIELSSSKYYEKDLREIMMMKEEYLSTKKSILELLEYILKNIPIYNITRTKDWYKIYIDEDSIKDIEYFVINGVKNVPNRLNIFGTEIFSQSIEYMSINNYENTLINRNDRLDRINMETYRRKNDKDYKKHKASFDFIYRFNDDESCKTLRLKKKLQDFRPEIDDIIKLIKDKIDDFTYSKDYKINNDVKILLEN